MPTPHKWAKEIKAWADGAEIEGRRIAEGSAWSGWYSPQWSSEQYEWRIKTRHQAVKDAFEAGAEVETRVHGLGHWLPVCAAPQWHEEDEYRVKERVFPVTSLSTQKLVNAYVEATKTWEGGYHAVANAAIKQYILDQEKKAND